MDVRQPERDLSLFRELITCGNMIYSWTFDTEDSLLSTNCPKAEQARNLLGIGAETFETLRAMSEQHRPVLMTAPLGMVWVADFEHGEGNTLHRIHAIGPIFLDEVSGRDMDRWLDSLKFSASGKRELRDLTRSLPVLSITRFYSYGLMLHYCLTGEKIGSSDFQYPQAKKESRHRRRKADEKESHGTWAMEQELLRLIEEGNLDYKKEAARLVSTGQLGNLGNGDPVRNMKNLTIVFTALCTRAAIRGGLTPEVAYSLSDHYISSIETCTAPPEIAEVNAAMQDDFVQRVHQFRAEGGISPQIQNCCNYLQLHLAENIPIPALAEKAGYSVSHFTRRFKQEVGMNASEYVMQKRIEAAKDALRLTDENIQTLAHRLGFNSQSYFGKQFKHFTGMSPSEYREKQGQGEKMPSRKQLQPDNSSHDRSDAEDLGNGKGLPEHQNT